MAKVGVGYLAWVPLGLEPFERFLSSYCHYAADLPHDLIVIFNGHTSPDELAPFHDRLRNVPHQPFPIAGPQQDIASYFATAEQFDHDYFCFVNSYSEIQAAAWLGKLYRALQGPDVGLVGATASWESLYRHKVFWKNPRAWLVSLAYNRRHLPFPNPHVRSTGFMLAGDLMRGLQRWPMRTKEDAYKFENSRLSLTRQVQDKSLKTLLVDCEGNAYAPADWAHTRTYRSGDQSRLLITDNRTALYAQADLETRRYMTHLAWGESALPLE